MMLDRNFARPNAFRALGFSHPPFGPLDDPASAWPRPSILGGVSKALAGGVGSVAITGDGGRGKTSLIGPLRAALGKGFTVGVLASGPTEGGVQHVLGAFEPGGAAPSRLEARGRLRDLLERRHREGRPCLLLVDDAHRLPEPSASALEKAVGSGAQGDAALRVVLTAPSADLRRSPAKALPRVEIRLRPLSPTEAAAYVRHRLRVAGGPADLFDDAAARELGSASGGAPQALNLLAAACLEAAAARGESRIDVDAVRAVSGAMRSAPSRAPRGEARSDPPAAAEPDAAVTVRSPDHLWVPTGPDEFLFSPRSRPASHGPAERAPAVARPADAAASPAPATPSADAPPPAPSAPADRPDPPRTASVEAVRAPGPTGAARGPARGRPARRVASPSSSRGWVVASTGAMMVAGMVIGAGIGWRMMPSSFAVGAGQPPAQAATPIDLGALAERAATSSSSALLAVTAGAEPGPGGDAIVPLAASLEVPPQSWEADARALYERAVDLAVEDPDAAIVAYARAALRGHARSARYLGQIYEVGDGVEASPELARAWYDFGGSGRDAAQGAPRDGAARPGRPSSAPVPMFSARLPDGAVELVWSGAGAGAGYRVEFARDPLAEPLGSLDTAISAAMVSAPRDVAFWRVAAGDSGRPEGWTPIGPPVAP